MVSAFLFTEKGLKQGGQSLIEEWRNFGGSLWLDIAAQSNANETEILLAMQCHPLAIQDIQRQNHPPKLEYFDNSTFVLYRHMRSLNDMLDADMQNIGFFIGKNFLISIHKEDFPICNEVSQHKDFTRLLQTPIELFCAIIRLSANQQLEQIIEIEEELSYTEDLITFHGSDGLLTQVITYRTHLRKLKRMFAYQEKVFAQLLKDAKTLPSQSKGSQHTLHDIYDKFERLLNLITLYYDLCSDLTDAYLSISSHQLNHTMKVLTVITAIFIPLSFIAGVYGMNFNNMPELQWQHGYFLTLLFMFCLACGLLLLFKYKKWL